MAVAAIAVVAATIVLHAGRVPVPLDGSKMPGWRLEYEASRSLIGSPPHWSDASGIDWVDRKRRASRPACSSDYGQVR